MTLNLPDLSWSLRRNRLCRYRFSALAAKAVTTRIAPDKEAAVAAILNKVRSLRANASDTETFDRNLSIVEDALPDLVD
ncbi:hypothetical protein NKI48_25380 [Mesorhizobium sp. M0644]|uniref:hypothetical protein n=1 Tax=Mesorhizobium sp. M0644 TaxID=2956979 RepID=UPI00333A0F60